MLLTPEKIREAIKETHKKFPGKVLPAMVIYNAIAQAQYEEDMKEAKGDRDKAPEGN